MLLREMSLDQLRQEYITLNTIIKKDLSNWMPQTRAGMLGRQREAEVKMKQLMGHMVAKIVDNSTVTVMPRSAGRQNIDEIVAKAKGGDNSVVPINYMFIESDILDAVFKGRNGYPFNVPSINAMDTLLTTFYREMGAVDMPQLPKDGSKLKVYTTKDEAMVVLEKMMDDSHTKENFKPRYFQHLFTAHILNNPELDSYNLVIFDVPDKYLNSFTFGKKTKIQTKLDLAVNSTTVDMNEPVAQEQKPKRASKKTKTDV